MGNWTTYQRDGKNWFKTSGGVELELLPIPSLVYRRKIIELNKNSPPVPYTTIRKAGKEQITPDYRDEGYESAQRMYLAEFAVELQSFVLSYVKVRVPKGFESSSDDEKERKIDYIAFLIPEDDELDALQDAIIEITMPSEEAIEESEENFPDSGE